MQKEFKHIQTAHCENGVTLGLLKYHGLDMLNEPLVFGIGSGLFYIHIPFLKLHDGPAISFRTMPGNIFKRTCKSLGVKIVSTKFNTPKQAQIYLDNKIAEGTIVGCQVGVFHLPYFPFEYRFHFNAHNIIVFDKDETHYSVSDPVMEFTTRLTPEELEKVRFVKGILAPKGHIYFPKTINKIDDNTLKQAIIKGIKRNTRDMLHIPGNIAGVRGIAYTSRKIRKWREELGEHRARLHLAQIVRMQEEIGTGGGGFRFLYAAFLEKASEIFKDDKLMFISNEFSKSGDLWRNSAVQMAGIFKKRLNKQENYNEIADILLDISEIEKQAFQKLSKIKLKI